VPTPLETKATPALPEKLPALAVFKLTVSALLEVPAVNPTIEPAPVNPAPTAPKLALRRSVKMSGDVLVTARVAAGAASPTRAASVSADGSSVGLATR